MKVPIRTIIGNLVWSSEGSVWAVYKITPRSYPFLHNREKLVIHGRLRAALLLMPDEFSFISICRPTGTDDLVKRMLGHVPTGPWEAEVLSTAEAVGRMAEAGIPMFERQFYLAVRVPSERSSKDLKLAASTAISNLFQKASGPAVPIPAAEVSAYRRRLAETESQLKALLGAQRATAGEIRWLYARFPLRGLTEPALGPDWEPPEPIAQDKLRGSLVSHLFGDARFFEGGHRPSLLAGGKKVDAVPDQEPPRHRRYVRIDTDEGTSYQTVVALSSLPPGWVFPNGNGEWFSQISTLAFPVDWSARVVAVPNEKAQIKARQQARELVAQVSEYDDEPSGPPAVLADAMEELEEERRLLAANVAEPELQVTTLFSVAANDLPTLESRARAIQALFQPMGYGAHRPSGNQSDLLRDFLPGTSRSLAAKDYSQFLLPGGFATSAPFTTAAVGDPEGILIGAAEGEGGFTPVLVDIDKAPSRDRSASLGVFGRLGSGKSYLGKRLCRGVTLRGGQVVIADRTARGEWVAAAAGFHGTKQIIDASPSSGFVLDPMQVFYGDERAQYATGVLALLTGSSPTDLSGVVLAEAVAEVAQRPSPHLKEVATVLALMPEVEAHEMSRKLRALERSPAARMLFGEGKPLTLDADVIVFWLKGIALPDRAMLTNEHLAKQMLPEQLVGYATLYLVAAVTRHVSFADPGRFSVGVYDEARMLTLSPYGRRLLVEAVRDGRKNNAAAWIISQHPGDLGDQLGGDDDRIADLLGYRVVCAHEHGATKDALEFLGMENTEDNQDLVASLASVDGSIRRALITDSSGRIGMVELFREIDPEIDDAFNTTAGLPA